MQFLRESPNVLQIEYLYITTFNSPILETWAFTKLFIELPLNSSNLMRGRSTITAIYQIILDNSKVDSATPALSPKVPSPISILTRLLLLIILKELPRAKVFEPKTIDFKYLQSTVIHKRNEFTFNMDFVVVVIE